MVPAWFASRMVWLELDVELSYLVMLWEGMAWLVKALKKAICAYALIEVSAAKGIWSTSCSLCPTPSEARAKVRTYSVVMSILVWFVEILLLLINQSLLQMFSCSACSAIGARSFLPSMYFSATSLVHDTLIAHQHVNWWLVNCVNQCQKALSSVNFMPDSLNWAEIPLGKSRSWSFCRNLPTMVPPA